MKMIRNSKNYIRPNKFYEISQKNSFAKIIIYIKKKKN